jgi:23S rRNA pseudouridine2605 synthase
MTERLQKILSQWGVASRRQAEQLILAGRVRLNGEVVAQLGQKADPERDAIEVDGALIQPTNRPEMVYLLLNKPIGVVSTCHDPQERTTVLQLLPPELQQSGIHPVGRLDANSSGALLLTNDGEVTFCLTHPRHSISKTYHVWVKGHPSPAALDRWRKGVVLDGKMTRPAQVRIRDTHSPDQTSEQSPDQSPDQTLLEIVLYEGRNRQIRRIADQLGYPVIRLHRVAIGPIRLGRLPRARFRVLHESEIRFLQAQVEQMRQSMPGVEIGERVI